MYPNKPPVKSIVPAAALAALVSLAACGGGGSSSAAAGSGGGGGTSSVGGTLTITAAVPAANDTTLNLASATTNGNDARAADAFSSIPYCEVFFEGFTGANGTTYALQVYFRQTDSAALNASIVGGNPPTYVVFDNAAGNPISGVAVDTAARTITFTNKVLTGSGGEAGTVNGTITFPANSTTPACGG